MSTIDQRILIVAPSEAAWLYLTDPAHISKWHRGAKQLSLLTTRATGVGARRRVVSTRGMAVVEEVTAWVDNIGYEYTVIDGPYSDFKGRFRLQPQPDGTLVHWIIEYRLNGLFGDLQDGLGFRNALNSQMTDSLRALKRLIESSGVTFDPIKQARFAMQADPGIEARAARMSEPTRPQAAKPIPVLGEDDVPELPPELPADQPTAIPTFVAAALTRPPQSKDDTKPRPPAGLRDAISPSKIGTKPLKSPKTGLPGQPPEAAPSANAEKTVEAPERKQYTSTTVPAALVAPPRPPDPITQTAAPAPIPVPPTLPPTVTLPPRSVPVAPPNVPENIPAAISEPTISRPPSVPPSVPPPPSDIRETGEMSIWDVFGLERPSDRNKAELDAVIASLATPLPQPVFRFDAMPGRAAPTPDTPSSPVASAVPSRAKVSVRVRRTDAPRRARAHVRVRK